MSVHLRDEGSERRGAEPDGGASGNLVGQTREGERKGSGLAGGGRPEGETHHVVGDVHAEDSGFVVHKRRRVEGEGGHADVDHVAVLLGQRKGRSRERRLLVLPDVVKLALSEERTQLWDVSPDQTFRCSDDRFNGRLLPSSSG